MHKTRVLLTALLLAPVLAAAQPTASAPTAAPAAAPRSAIPADPWPRKLDLANGAAMVYQPQVNRWDGNKLDLRAAVALQPAGEKQETYGVVFATARTHVDKVARTVVIDNLAIYKSDFPLLPDRGKAYAPGLAAGFASGIRTISLDRMEAALAASGLKPPAMVVDNTPPQIIVSNTPAILVPIDGAPVQKATTDDRFQRVVNTRALILRAGLWQKYFVKVYDGWLWADSLAGPWTQPPMVPVGLNDLAQQIAAKGTVDLLDGGPKANPKPTLANGAPALYTAQGPAELIVFEGQPDFAPIVGTELLWATNTHSDVLIDTTSSLYYVLLAGRWFRAPGMAGPWTYVANDALPRGFANIPPHSLAGAVLPSVAGTPQAQQALIANSIPQTATVPRGNGPKFTPNFDGAPQWRPIDGTPLSYVVNSPAPIIRVDASSYYAVSGGVWFSATALTGPWAVAASVPAIVYSIPASSPLHYVTYVQIYEATPQYVYVGYTPGYMGTVVSPSGTVVYGTGYAYTPWIGDLWFPAPVTYTVAAVPIYNPYVGFTFGFATGLAASAWTYPYYGGAWYYPAYWGGYPCCATASANVYGQWGNTVYSGTRSWYAGGGVAGTTASGTYANARTGTSGSYAGGSQFNAWTGNATRAYDRTANGAAGGSGNVARASNYNVYTGQRSTASSVSGTTAGGSTYDRSGATTVGPEGVSHTGGGSTYNANTGESRSWSTGGGANDHYADSSGNVYRNLGSGWEQHSAGGWSGAGGDTSWADREAQARSTGADRWGSVSASERDRFGGGGSWGGGGFGGSGGGERFGGGASYGGRFGGGGFGGGGFRGRR